MLRSLVGSEMCIRDSLHRVRFSSPPSLAYAFSHTSITYSGISRVSVGSYHRKHIWPRGWGNPEPKRLLHSLIVLFPLSIVFGTLNLTKNMLYAVTCDNFVCLQLHEELLPGDVKAFVGKLLCYTKRMRRPRRPCRNRKYLRNDSTKSAHPGPLIYPC